MRRILIALAVLATTATIGVPSFAADSACPDKEAMKPMKGAMQHRPPQLLLMKAYHRNVVNFGEALAKVAREGETVPPAFARSAVAEMRRSTEEIEKYRAESMSRMPQGMGEVMQQRMNEHLVDVKTHLRQLEEVVKSDRIPSAEVLKHLQFISQGCGAMDTAKPCCDGHGHREMQGHGGMPGCGCQEMMQMKPDRHQKMEEMMQKMKSQDAELAAEVEQMKRASKDRKIDLLSDIVTRLVQQRAELTAQRENMHMRHGCGEGHHGMRHGEMMAPPPMVRGMDGEGPDEDEDNLDENGE